MFVNKNKKMAASEEGLITKVNQDMTVRNMPVFNHLNAKTVAVQNSEQTDGNTLASFSSNKNDHKLVGLLIIIGGFLVIAGLVYASYVFIIKPQAAQPAPQIIKTIPETKSIVDNLLTTTSEVVVTATTSVVATVTPSILETASSSDPLTMNEELNGKQNTNLPPLLDSDNDGLNDEEELILGTNANLADSNGNTYSDLVEITNGYDPVVSGKISANPYLNKYTNPSFRYEILYPKEWLVNTLNNDSTITFTAPDDSLIQISVQDNTDHQSILGWYGETFANDSITYDILKITSNWDGIMGADKLNFYLTDKKKNTIYIISYIPAVDGRLAYQNIYNLMINSFFLK